VIALGRDPSKGEPLGAQKCFERIDSLFKPAAQRLELLFAQREQMALHLQVLPCALLCFARALLLVLDVPSGFLDGRKEERLGDVRKPRR